MNTILMALDFSKFSPEVTKVGFALAKKIDARVIITTIVNKNIEYVPTITGEVFADQWEARQHIALENLENVKKEYNDSPVEIVSFIGDPKTDIIDTAISRHATFIVIGTHGRTGLSNLLLGSTAEYIVRHSPVPVIVVPYKKEKH